MYYTMRLVEGKLPRRVGRMTRTIDSRIREARKHGGYVEKYGHGVVWTPKDENALKGTAFDHTNQEGRSFGVPDKE